MPYRYSSGNRRTGLRKMPYYVIWLVTNITELHHYSRFPLLGAHRTADCSDCHRSENMVRFDVIGVNCIDCHREDYMATTQSNQCRIL